MKELNELIMRLNAKRGQANPQAKSAKVVATA
jgi:hypothetical protein